MNLRYSKDFDVLIKDELFLSFLKYQIQGVFNHFYCDHVSLNKVCFSCTGDFIKKSEFKNTFEKLYHWFKESKFQPHYNNQKNYFNSFTKVTKQKKQKLAHDIDPNDTNPINFYPQDIFECFDSIVTHLTSDEVKYFCSPWLDGMCVTYHNIDHDVVTIRIIFGSLCIEGHLETLQWFYKSIEPYFKLTKYEQRQIFSGVCNQKPQKNINSHEILSWLFSLKIFEQLDVHLNNEHAFRTVCLHNNTAALKFLLNLKGDQEIDVHVQEEDAFRNACELGHSNVVEMLLDLKGPREVNVHIKNEYAFRYACYRGHIEIVRILLNLKGTREINVHADNDGVFFDACRDENIELLMLLLDLEGNRKFTSTNTHQNAFKTACYHGNTEIIQILLKRVYNQNYDHGTITDLECRRTCEEGLGKAYLGKQLSVIHFLEGLLL